MPAPKFLASSVTELVAIRARDQPDKVAYYTGIDEPGSPLRSLTYSQVQRGVDRLCHHYTGLGLLPADPHPQRTIAVLTSTAIDESLLEIALAKLSLAPLLLSVNNSVPAVANLCKLTKATHLIHGSKYLSEAQDTQKQLAQENYQLEIVPEKRFPIWGPDGVDNASIKSYAPVLTPAEEWHRTAVILHSSGSTGFPKPVYITHKGLIANVHGFVSKPGFSALPVYHGFGHYTVFRCAYGCVPLTLIPPHLPLTSANICKIIKASPTKCELCFAVPYVIKLLGETKEGIKALAEFESVTYSGAAVPDDLGDRLTAAGVNLISIYGSTETGSLLKSTRNFETDKAWNWVRAEGLITEYLVMEDRGSGTYESVVKDGWPAKIESNRPDKSYATKDLFLRHPEHDKWFKYCGRLDDTLVQVLGEKTNPVPIELAIRGNSSYVEEAIVFGAGRPQVGCLILPSELGKDLSKDRDAFLDKIWPVVEDANAQAPTHSRILPEMVHILEYGTQIPVATKMSILRPACYAKFKNIIDNVYERFEHGSGVDRLDLSKLELEEFIFNAITQTLGVSKAAKLNTTTDLFAFGVDSLQATRIRNICQKELELEGHTLGQNVVYENPSIEKLASYILELRSGGNVAKSDEQQQATMLAMVDKWSNKFAPRQVNFANGVRTRLVSQTVVLTGATGSLGAHILQQLASSPSVSKIICLSRAKSHTDSLMRLRQSLQLRQLNLSPEQWNKVDSFAANVNEDQLGLTPDEYGSLLSQTTSVIHNAWPVNFVLSVDSFDEHIGGALNLINLCLRAKSTSPSFFFSSSISTSQGSPDLVCKEDFPPSPSTANSTGYGRSKWVTEKLCEKAGKDTPLNVGVMRIGQLVGDTENGVWNETEAWPLMFKSASTTGVLPRLDDRPSWLPVNIAGRAIVEIATRPQPTKAAVYHIVNPNTSSDWDVVLAGLKGAGMQFDIVDRATWLDRLANSDTDAERNPAIKLLGYYRGRFGKLNERPPLQFRVDLTSKVAPSIGHCPPISAELVGKWVEHWRSVGFL